jgi:hypothetical protein
MLARGQKPSLFVRSVPPEALSQGKKGFSVRSLFPFEKGGAVREAVRATIESGGDAEKKEKEKATEKAAIKRHLQ